MGHWYDKEGNPQHYVMGKDGVMRDSTLRDARPHNWFPSVTEVLGIVDKPGLNRAKLHLCVAEAMKPKDGVAVDDIIRSALQHWEDARERGDLIHNCLEDIFKEKLLTAPKDVIDIAGEAAVAVTDYCGTADFTAEATIVGPGFGGMVDLHNDDFVIDWKTKNITDKQWAAYEAGKDPRMAYPENCMQLSAYDVGLDAMHDKAGRFYGPRRLINVYIDREIPGRVIIHEWQENMYDRFELLLKYWRLFKNYFPE